jgi:hypothetical protein
VASAVLANFSYNPSKVFLAFLTYNNEDPPYNWLKISKASSTASAPA